MKRVTSMTAALVLSTAVLTGCSGGGTDAYCEDLKSAAQDFDSLDTGDFAKFEDFLDKAKDIADKAPDEVKDEWDTLLEALNGFVDALEEAGIELSDLEALQNGETPEGVDPTKILEAMSSIDLDSEEVEKAGDTISQHAKDECGVDLE